MRHKLKHHWTKPNVDNLYVYTIHIILICIVQCTSTSMFNSMHLCICTMAVIIIIIIIPSNKFWKYPSFFFSFKAIYYDYNMILKLHTQTHAHRTCTGTAVYLYTLHTQWRIFDKKKRRNERIKVVSSPFLHTTYELLCI